MAKLPDIFVRCNAFLRDHGVMQGMDTYDVPPPYELIVFHLVTGDTRAYTVKAWQKWNDQHGYGDM